MAQPEQKFRCGACEVAIFENTITTKDGEKIRTKKASFQKRYKNSDGEWKSTHSLDINDIPKAKLVLNEAFKYMALSKDIEQQGENSPTS